MPDSLQAERRTSRRGFTLVELVLVFSIIAVFAALATPRYVNSILRYRADAAAKRIQLDLEYARTRARTVSASRTMTFSALTDAYSITGETSMDRSGQPYRVQLSDEPYRSDIRSLDLGGDGQIVFNGFGMPDADGAIIISAGTIRKAIIIDAATGEITITDATAELKSSLALKGVAVQIN